MTEKFSFFHTAAQLKTNFLSFFSIVQPLYAQSKLLEGAARLIRHLKANGIPIAIATSSSEATLAEKTKNHREVFDLFEHVVTGSHPDLKNGKPAPDIFLLSARYALLIVEI